MSWIHDMIGRIVAACILSALLDCIVDGDENAGTLRMICGLYVSGSCIRAICRIVEKLL